MPTPPLIDIDALTAPVPGPDPAGKPAPFAVREQLETARKEIDPRLFDKNDPLRPTEEVRADWALVIRVATETLAATSKDLLIAARLTEALTRRHGFAGVRDGLGLLRRLIEGCWDRLLPPIEEEEDVEVRAAAFSWLNDADRGARFPHTLRAVPLVGGAEAVTSWKHWKDAQNPPKDANDKRPAEAKAAFERAVLAAPRETCQDTVDDLRAAAADLDALDRALDKVMGRHAPALSGIREGLGQCLALAEQVLAKKGPAPVTASPDVVADDTAPAEAPAGTNGSATAPTPRREKTRADHYQQIADTAAALRTIEPHSPIPYLLERAVELGSLPFPELMKVLVRNPDVLTMMNRELGIRADEEKK